MKKQMDLLEVSVLDLGAEVFRLRSALGELKEQKEAIKSALSSITQLLEDKGLLTTTELAKASEHIELLKISRDLADIDQDEDDRKQEVNYPN